MPYESLYHGPVPFGAAMLALRSEISPQQDPAAAARSLCRHAQVYQATLAPAYVPESRGTVSGLEQQNKSEQCCTGKSMIRSMAALMGPGVSRQMPACAPSAGMMFFVTLILCVYHGQFHTHVAIEQDALRENSARCYRAMHREKVGLPA